MSNTKQWHVAMVNSLLRWYRRHPTKHELDKVAKCRLKIIPNLLSACTDNQ